MKDFLSFLERPTVEVFYQYMQPDEMIFEPSNFAHVVLTLSQGRSAIADWEGCDRGDPRRVTDCLKQYPSHVTRLCMHFDIYEKFEISRTVGPRRTPGTVVAERTDHFIDEPTQWFLDRCPGEVDNITPWFQSQISSQRWPDLVVEVRLLQKRSF